MHQKKEKNNNLCIKLNYGPGQFSLWELENNRPWTPYSLLGKPNKNEQAPMNVQCWMDGVWMRNKFSLYSYPIRCSMDDVLVTG